MADLVVRRCRPLLGTFVEIAAPAGGEEAVDHAFAAIAHVQARMSFHDEASDLAALRRARPGEIVRVDAETVRVLRCAETLHRRSDGLFDVTRGARLVASRALPAPPGVDPDAVPDGDATDLEIIDDRHVRCRRSVLIDLGGIAKGHAVDRAAETLIAAGIDRALVNAGGDLRVVGAGWQEIGLRRADGTIGAAIRIADAALATSAADPVRPVHVARGGGWTIRPDAVSVVAPSCILADAMTKIALAEPALAAAMLDERGGAIVALAPADRA